MWGRKAKQYWNVCTEKRSLYSGIVVNGSHIRASSKSPHNWTSRNTTQDLSGISYIITNKVYRCTLLFNGNRWNLRGVCLCRSNFAYWSARHTYTHARTPHISRTIATDLALREPAHIPFLLYSRQLALFKGHLRRIFISLMSPGPELSYNSGCGAISQGALLWVFISIWLLGKSEEIDREAKNTLKTLRDAPGCNATHFFWQHNILEQSGFAWRRTRNLGKQWPC